MAVLSRFEKDIANGVTFWKYFVRKSIKNPKAGSSPDTLAAPSIKPSIYTIGGNIKTR